MYKHFDKKNQFSFYFNFNSVPKYPVNWMWNVQNGIQSLVPLAGNLAFQYLSHKACRTVLEIELEIENFMFCNGHILF